MQESKIYICTICGHQHDESTDGSWENLPKYWNCPDCGCAKEEYEEATI